MKDKLLLIWKHLKPENLQKMWLQSKWIWQYGKRYWKSMVVYTLLGIAGSGVSLVSSFISKDLIDIITGHQTGKLLSTFAAMIGFSIANILFSQASTYASTFINLKVNSEIKNDIFAKMLVTDWESLTDYHTGDLVTRWSSDASNISSGILNWIPNLVIYIFRFISALAVVLYYDPTFALFALIGIPFSAILSKPLLRRMSNNNAKSAAMNAKMYGFNQETFSNIQTIKAFDLIHFYIERLKSLQKEYIQMRMDFQKMSMLTSILMTLIGFIVSYSCYGWGIYRVWSNAITYGTMTMFLSLSGTLTSSVNSLASLVPSAVSLTISAGRLMDIVEMPQEDYSHDAQVLSKPLLRRMSNNNAKSAAMNAKMYGFNQETFSNIQTIKAFDLIHFYIERLKSLQKEYIQMRMDFQKMSMLTSILMTLIGFIVSYSCYGWGIYRVWSNAITYGTMTMFLSLSGTLTSSVNSLASLVPSAVSLTISAGRLMDIVEMPQEDYSHDAQVIAFEKDHRSEGIGIAMQDLSYSYNTGTEVFRDASIEAYPHEIVALVGPSGEGKTTMLRLILSLLQPSGGSYHVCAGDNHRTQIEMSPSTRKLFSYVPQGNTMFSGTIAENMRNVKPDATDEEIIHALQLACAWDFVEKLPDGIQSMVKERGGGFSEGQAQRLSIARALLRHSPILLLDEATSALDVATERKVLKNIMQDTYPRTCIVTTHRPTVLNICTRVYAIREKKCEVLKDEEIEKLMGDF